MRALCSPSLLKTRSWLWNREGWHHFGRLCLSCDGAFQNDSFRSFAALYSTTIRPVPPRRHGKNAIEPIHGAICLLFLRLQHASPTSSDAILAVRAARISNDLYGSDIMSAYEAANGFARPPAPGEKAIPVYDNLLLAHQELMARSNLTCILRAHSLKPFDFKRGYLVQIYVHHSHEKRGKWLSLRHILAIGNEPGLLTVPGLSGNTVNATFEDARTAFPVSDIAESVMSPTDELYDSLDVELSNQLGDTLIPLDRDNELPKTEYF